MFFDLFIVMCVFEYNLKDYPGQMKAVLKQKKKIHEPD